MITNTRQDPGLNSSQRIGSLSGELNDWLGNKLGGDNFVVEPVFTNIATPSYFGITIAGETHLLIDASWAAVDHAEYSKISKLLRAAQINAPEVITEDSRRGFYLLTDVLTHMGRETYKEALTEANADALFRDARTTLINWQLASRADTLPVGDATFLRNELEQFSHHYLLGHLGIALTVEQAQTIANMFNVIVAANATQANVYVHRDYVPDNLIASTPGPGVLGFQGAMFGAISYDIVSLYRSATVLCDEERSLDGMIRYWESAKKANLPVPADFGDFYRDAEWMGLQRHLTLIANMAKKSTQYSNAEKSKKLDEMTQLIRYVRQVGERYVALFPLIRLFDKLNINDGVPRTVGISF